MCNGPKSVHMVHKAFISYPLRGPGRLGLRVIHG